MKYQPLKHHRATGHQPWVGASVLMILTASAIADPLFWNVGGSGGNGNWGTSPGERNWNTAVGQPVAGNLTWPDDEAPTAVFADAIGGTVTLIDMIELRGIELDGASYQINAGMMLPAGPAEPFLMDVRNGELALNTVLGGTAGIIKDGGGRLALLAPNTATGAFHVLGGTVDLLGSLANPEVTTAAGAEFINSSGGLADVTEFTNAGTLTMDANDTIGAYTSDGGLLRGPGRLEVSGDATLGGGSAVSGTLEAVRVLITGGTTDLTGSLFANVLDIAAGGQLTASGAVEYEMLTTSGAGAGVWDGDLVNQAVISPDGDGFGTLQITGDLENTSSGVLRFDISTAGSDLLQVGGEMRYGGTLDLRAAGELPMSTNPIQLIDAGSSVGNIQALTSDLGVPVWFNPDEGTIAWLNMAHGGGLGDLSSGQLSTFLALYEEAIDPGVVNVFDGPPLVLTSGVLGMENPGLASIFTAATAAGGLDSSLLNRLSPGVYGAFGNHAMQATLQNQRTAMAVPATRAVDAHAGSSSAKSGAKSGAKTPVGDTRPIGGWETFAAIDHFHARARGLGDEGDFNLNGTGFLIGARGAVAAVPSLTLYLAGHDGRVSGDLLRADVDGVSLGAVGEWLLPVTGDVRLTSALSYGRYQFDGTRTTVAAGPGGWMAAEARFQDVTAHSVEWYVGVTSRHDVNPAVRVAPTAGLRFASGAMRGFQESTTAGALALEVMRDNYFALLFESGIAMEADVHERATLIAEMGFVSTLNRSGHGMNARFIQGDRPIQADLGGLSEDVLYFGLGLAIDVRENMVLLIGGHAERRGGGDRLNRGAISLVARF